MKHLRQDNTNGVYSDEELEIMNQEVDELLKENGYDENDDTMYKYYCAKVVNDH